MDSVLDGVFWSRTHTHTDKRILGLGFAPTAVVLGRVGGKTGWLDLVREGEIFRQLKVDKMVKFGQSFESGQNCQLLSIF